jgi:hypothetical protein
MRGAVIVGLITGLAACTTGGSEDESYMTYCASQGLEPGGDLFDHCLERRRVEALIEVQRIRSMRELRPYR